MNNFIDNEQIKAANSKSLAVWVVVYRTLGVYKDLSIKCMKELARRRKEDNDQFNYESFIDEEVKKFPKPQKMDFMGIIKTIKNKGGI